MRRLGVRLASLAASAALILLALWLALHASRGALDLRPPPDDAVIAYSEIARPPRPAPRRAPSSPPTPAQAPAPVASSTPATSAPLDDVVLTVTDPIWLTRPAHPERFYPHAAFMRGIEGRVELACAVALDGQLACEIVSEAPLGEGFGEAALALAHAHVMAPLSQDGRPARGSYRMVAPFTTE